MCPIYFSLDREVGGAYFLDIEKNVWTLSFLKKSDGKNTGIIVRLI